MKSDLETMKEKLKFIDCEKERPDAEPVKRKEYEPLDEWLKRTPVLAEMGWFSGESWPDIRAMEDIPVPKSWGVKDYKNRFVISWQGPEEYHNLLLLVTDDGLKCAYGDPTKLLAEVWKSMTDKPGRAPIDEPKPGTLRQRRWRKKREGDAE